MLKVISIFLLIVILLGLGSYYFLVKGKAAPTVAAQDSTAAKLPAADSSVRQQDTLSANNMKLPPSAIVETARVPPQDLVAFAVTQLGVPYKYGSTDPTTGFDCSGFITYVFNHFKIAVPRSSVEFTNVGTEVSVQQAKQGDLILFTGTNPAERTVGHMGIVISNSDTLRFIHSTSGKEMGVTITPLNAYYQERLVKLIRVFN